MRLSKTPPLDVLHYLTTRVGYTAVKTGRWLPYRDAWDRPDLEVAMSEQSIRIMQLHHGQVAQIAFNTRLIYFALPKAANSFLRRWMNSQEALSAIGAEVSVPSDATYTPSSQYCHTLAQLPGGLRLGITKPDFRFFTAVRNPYDRLLSAYLDKRRGSASPIQSKLPRKAWSTFPNFVRSLSKGDRLHSDGHWAPQTWILKPVLRDIDEFLRVETLGKDLIRLSDLWGLPEVKQTQDSAHHKRGTSKLIEQYFDSETLAIVSHLYKDDFAQFGYALRD